MMNPMGMPLTAFSDFSVLQPKRKDDPRYAESMAPTLSAAYRKRMRDDPRYDRISGLEQGAMNHIDNSGWAGVAAQLVNGYMAGKERRSLEADYTGQQEQRKGVIANLLASQKDLDPMVAQMAQDPEYGDFAVTSLLKSKLDPKEAKKYSTVEKPDGTYAWDPTRPDAPMTKIAEAKPKDKPADVQEYEFAISQIPEGQPKPSYTDWTRENKKAGASNNTVVTKMESEWDKNIGGEMAKVYIEQQNRARAADSTIGQIGRFRTVMGNTKMGPVASATLPVRSALNELGITDDKNVPNQEELTAMSNRFALDVVGNMKGPPSDKDMVFAKDTVVSLAKSNPGNTAILDVAERVALRDQQYAQWQDEYRKANGGRLDPGVNEYIRQKSDENPMFTPQERQQLEAAKSGGPATSAYSKTAVNPKTGEKAGWDGSKWVKIP